MPEDVRHIEEVAANAWPALVVQHVDGWWLRFTPGARMRRPNSVLPNDGSGTVALADKIAAAEEFYSGRAVPVRFQMSPAAVPDDLDGSLEARGYEVEAPVQVMVADLAGMADAVSGAAPGRLHVSDEPGERWLDTWISVSGRGDGPTLRRVILDRIAGSVGYVAVEIDDRVAAVGMGVAERGWLGVFSMGTLPEFRRRGAASAVLAALARWGTDRGATRAYLQMEPGNEQAARLYTRAGFREAYRYHYRTLAP